MPKTINVTFLTLYCCLIFWLSSQSSLPAPMLFIHQDKLVHLGAYFIMGVLAWRVFRAFFKKSLTTAVVSLLFCSLYGISDEWHQSYVPGRDADVFDWIADTLGASIALLVMHLKTKNF